MMSGSSICGLVFVICVTQCLFSTEVSCAFLCKDRGDCNCSKGSDGSHEIRCYLNVPEYSEVLFIKIKQNDSYTVTCYNLTKWSYLSLVSAYKVPSAPKVTFLYCPLPDSSKNISSFRAFFDSIGLEDVTTISFVSHNHLTDGLKSEHLTGLNGVTKLTLMNNGLTLLPKDSFSGVPDLKWLNLLSNQIQLQPELFHKLHSLNTIELGNNNIASVPIELFHGLRNLSQLNLWGNKLGHANLSRTHFKDLVMLESLDLSSNSLASLDEDIFYDLVSLKQLSLNSNRFSSLPRSLFLNNKNLKGLRLNFNNGRLLSLPNGLLSNLSSLTSVSFNKSSIESLPGDLFRGSGNIETLSLWGNKLKSLPGDIFVGLKYLKSLNLKENQLSDLSPITFKQLSSLIQLTLSFNNLTQLPTTLFHDLSSLKVLDMRNNKLKTLQDSTFTQNDQLREAYFSNNEIYFEDMVPDELFDPTSPFTFCLSLEVLDLANNAIKHIYSDWKFTMLNLRELNLSRNALSTLSLNDLQFSSQKLMFVDLRYNNISVINLLGLDWERDKSRTTKILLDNNPINCDCDVFDLLKFLEGRIHPKARSAFDLQANELYCSYPNDLAGKKLTDLNSRSLMCDLKLATMDDDESILLPANWTESDEFINEKCPASCKCLFRPEDGALIVDCREGKISRFPHALPVIRRTAHIELWASNLGLTKLWPASSLLLGYNKIGSLNLSGNALSNIEASSLPPHLKVLDLHHNNLTHLDKSVFEAIKNTNEISLHANPWHCDCDAKDLLEFVQEKFKQVKNLSNITCESGYALGIPLSQLRLNDLCPMSYVIAIVCISLAVLGLTIGVFVALYYRHQDEIKIWLYAHHLCLWFVTEDELDKDKEYDAFISYSHQDESFVVEELVPVLEGLKFPEKSHPGDIKISEKKDAIKYKLCLHYRDWVAGQWIPTQITRSVNLSRRTIVVLSPSFLESVWGQMEFRAAHCRSLSEGRSRVIVILYGDVPPADQLDPELRTYLTTNTYVKWGDPWFWQKLRYALPHYQTRNRKKAAVSHSLGNDVNGQHWEAFNGHLKQVQVQTIELNNTNLAAVREVNC